MFFKLFSFLSGSSIGDFVTHSLTEPLFDFGTQGATLETCNLVEGGVMMIFLQFCPLYVENIARGITWVAAFGNVFTLILLFLLLDSQMNVGTCEKDKNAKIRHCCWL